MTGALLVLAAGITSGNPMSRLLSFAPLTYIGQISYALYLWHWPLLGLTMLGNSRWDLGFNGWQSKGLALLLTFGAAAISHVLIENPVRYSPALKASLKKTYAVAGLAMGIPALAIGAYLVTGDIGGRITPATSQAATTSPVSPAASVPLVEPMTPLEASEDRVTVLPKNCHIAQDDAAIKSDCVVGEVDSERVAVIFGDSHAQMWLPALDRAGKLYGWKILAETKSACTPYDVPIYNTSFERNYTECMEWSRAVVEHLDEIGGVDLVVIARSLAYNPLILDQGEHDVDEAVATGLWKDGAGRTFSALNGIADHIVVVEDTPWAPTVVPDCLSEKGLDSGACDFSLDAALKGRNLLAAERDAAPPSVTFVSMNDIVCASDPCPVVTPEGVIKYRDRHHLTQTYSASLAEIFGERIGLVGKEPG